jgi:hypothetical protein
MSRKIQWLEAIDILLTDTEISRDMYIKLAWTRKAKRA